MTEKEMIEEMAKDLKNCLPSSWYWLKSVDSDTYFVAKHFYEEGYRKPLEGSVVLTKEEYARLAIFQFETAQQIMNETRKETAKEILQTIWEELGIDILSQCYTIPVRTFNKLKNQYNVEVEE